MPTIQKTRNYKQFKLLHFNRDINLNHVNSLKIAIETKNKLCVNPIIVNSDYEVIDGQHRLQAAKELNVDIFYIVDEEYEETDIIIENTNRMLWNESQYVQYYAKKGLADYVFLNELMKYMGEEKLPFNCIRSVLPPFAAKNRVELNAQIKKGMLTIVNKPILKDFIYSMLPWCKHMNFLTIGLNRKMPRALFFKAAYFSALAFCFLRLEKKHFESLLSSIEKNYLRLINFGNMADVLLFFEQCYNKGRRTNFLEINDLKKIENPISNNDQEQYLIDIDEE
jgi:hypothetical protein